jgi:hypothetical protein
MRIHMHAARRDARSTREEGLTGALMRGPRRAALVALPAALILVTGCQDLGSEKTPQSSSSSPTAGQRGNGVERLSASEILDRAGKATTSARSVRIRGKLREGGDVLGLDVRIAGRSTAAGSITMQGERIRLVRVGSAAYIKGDAKFWKSIGGQDAASIFVGKYLKTTADNKDFKDLMSLTALSEIVSEIVKPEGELTKGARAQVNGVAAITLLDGAGGKLYVATEGQPYVLRLSPDAGDERLDFLAYNQTMKIQRPPGRLVIDID